MSGELQIARGVWLEMIRRKDVYIILGLQGVLTFLLTSLNAFGSEVPSSYIMDVGLITAFLLSLCLAVIMGARQIPQEERTGTILTILTKPLTRWEFLLGKWLGVWGVLIVTNLLFYAIVAGVTMTRGFPFEAAVLLQVFLLHLALLGIVAAVSLTFSLCMTQAAAGTSTGIFFILCFFLLPRIPAMLLYETGVQAWLLKAIYWLFPHLNLFDMRARLLHNWGAPPFGVFAGTLLYGAMLTGVTLLLAWLIFRRKQFRRGVER